MLEKIWLNYNFIKFLFKILSKFYRNFIKIYQHFIKILPHSAPSWILSLAENLASSNLQDGARTGTIITQWPSQPATYFDLCYCLCAVSPPTLYLSTIYVRCPHLDLCGVPTPVWTSEYNFMCGVPPWFWKVCGFPTGCCVLTPISILEYWSVPQIQF